MMRWRVGSSLWNCSSVLEHRGCKVNAAWGMLGVAAGAATVAQRSRSFRAAGAASLRQSESPQLPGRLASLQAHGTL